MTDRPARKARTGRRLWPRMPEVVGVLWGAAEATFFFIVPDVWISFMALRSLSDGFRAAIGALLGAAVAGSILSVYAESAQEAAFALVDAVPGVTTEVVSRASALAEMTQPIGMIIGSISGLPYKVFAVLLGPDMSLPAFFGTSVLARAPRFFGTLLLTWLVGRFLLARISSKIVYGLLVAIWCAIYVILFSITGF